MVDTHCHLYDEAFDFDRREAVQRAVADGVDTMLLPGIDSTSHSRQEALAAEYPQYFRQMMGLHPTSVTDDFEPELAIVQEKLFSPAAGYVGVGEIGLDLYWDKTYYEQQREVLKRQMLWARDLGLPVCLHVRKAYNELFGLLRDLNFGTFSGVMHCFGGSVNQALRAIDSGMYIGIGGVVTFKNAGMAEVVRAVPLERIVLETDSPYLAPVPYRGHRNESAYVVEVARKVAEIKELNMEKVAETTSANAAQLFGL